LISELQGVSGAELCQADVVSFAEVGSE
jgi:hypothetical protein